MRTSETFDDFFDRLKERLHPDHFKQIDAHDAIQWWYSLDGDPVHDESWHMNRLGNRNGPTIGGSEIGALVADELGDAPPFDLTPSLLFERKLLMRPLEASNEAMAFGNLYEDVARAMFEKEHPYLVRDDAAIAALREANGTLTALAYSPDDIFLLANGRRALIDYKSPYTGLIPVESEISLGYASQLHQGRKVLNDLDFKVDHMMLVYFSHPKSLARPKKPAIKTFQIAFDEVIEEAIKKRSAIFAQQVFKRDHPGYIWLPAEKRVELATLDKELMTARKQMDALEKRRREIESSMSDITIGLTKLQVSELPLSMTPVVRASISDQVRAAAYLKEAGVDIADFESKDKSSVDTARLLTDFLALSENVGEKIDQRDYHKPVIDSELLVNGFKLFVERHNMPGDTLQAYVVPGFDVHTMMDKFPAMVDLGIVKKSMSWSLIESKAEKKPKEKKAKEVKDVNEAVSDKKEETSPG